MSLSLSAAAKTRLENLIALARLLERIETSADAVGAEQYRGLVQQIGALLEDELPHEAVEAVLAAFPATAELYENLTYDKAGLSRSPLDRSVAAEMKAAALLRKLAAQRD
jgi:hypothetical protein